MSRAAKRARAEAERRTDLVQIADPTEHAADIALETEASRDRREAESRRGALGIAGVGLLFEGAFGPRRR